MGLGHKTVKGTIRGEREISNVEAEDMHACCRKAARRQRIREAGVERPAEGRLQIML